MPSLEAAECTLQVCESAEQLAAAGTDATLKLDRPLRILPGRREVRDGQWLETCQRIVCKCYLPHPKMEREWKREWAGLLQLQRAGIPAPQPLFTAKDPISGALSVVMRYIAQAETLKSLLPELGARRGAIMEQLSEVMAEMHKAGARQTDQHIGNWAYDGKNIYLLDAGTVRFAGKPLTMNERIDDLATLCATLDLPSQDAFRAAPGNTPFANRLPIFAVKKQCKRLKKHYKKTRRNCTEYTRRDAPEHRGVSSNKANQSLVDAFFRSPEEFMEQGTRLKSGNTCTLQSFQYQGQYYVLKRYNVKSLPTRLRQRMKESRAMKSWSNAWCLLTAHIPTARPVAVYEEQQGVLRGSCYLLMEQLDGALLTDYLAANDDSTALAKAVGSVTDVWRALAGIRAVHKDMKATNWMVNHSSEAAIFDLDALDFALPKLIFKRGRKKDYQRFMTNWTGAPRIAEQFRKQLLEAGL